jgi:hypothetical protein
MRSYLRRNKQEIRRKNRFQDLLTPPATTDQSNPSETTHTNQADTEEELEEEPPDILDTEMAYNP